MELQSYDQRARKVEFNQELGFDGNSREAVENRLLDMYMMVLSDRSNMDETKLPLDNTTTLIKDVVLPIAEGPVSTKNEFSFKYTSPTFQLSKKYEYSGGKNGIGPFALNNVHHVLTQLTQLEFKYHPMLETFGFGSLHGIDSKVVHDYKRDKYGRKINEKGEPTNNQIGRAHV